MDSSTATVVTRTFGVAPCVMRAKQSNIQCHKYRGKLIRPNHTRTRFDKTQRLIHACAPAEIINAAPTVGKSAHQPGKCFSLVMTAIASAMSIVPAMERKLPILELFVG